MRAPLTILLLVLTAILALAIGMFVLNTPASADPPIYTYGGGSQALYDSQGNYVRPQTITNSSQVWQGEDGQYRCRRKNGTTGLVIGAVAGGVLGNVIAGRGDKTLGTVLGAVGGGLIGRAIERRQLKCQ